MAPTRGASGQDEGTGMVSASGLLPVMVLLPFIGALAPGLMIRAGRNACATFAAVPTILALVFLGVMAPDVMAGNTVTAQFSWLPQLGLNANFFLDGLGLLFAGMILGVGLLVIIYARFFLSESHIDKSFHFPLGCVMYLLRPTLV